MKNKSNIVLIGFMGCGKSTIGKILANKLDYYFYDTDILVEKEIGMPISKYFAEHGETEFRLLEERIISQVSMRSKAVIASGGGIVKNHNNILSLRNNGIIFYLKGSPNFIFDRLRYDTTRPLLNTNNKLETIKNLLKERSPLYENASDFIIDIDNQSSDDIVVSILSHIRR